MGHELPRHFAERAAVMPPNAAAPSRDDGGRGGPQRDSCSAAKLELFDHLVGASEQGERHGDAERLRRLQVDNQLDLGRLRQRQVGWLFRLSRCGPCRRRKVVRFGKVAVAANSRSAQREASRVQRLKSIFNCLSSAMV
jgi:hypothetical protein